ncbi:MAG: outer membrane lipoprotein carrier protein LolA [Candidatus Tectimicrobiota bacterium]
MKQVWKDLALTMTSQWFSPWYSIVLWLSLCQVVSAAPSAELEKLIDKVQQTYEHTKALTADFIQVATLSSLSRQQTSSGRVYIEKPHAIRWEYTQPDTQTILYDGTTLRIYTPKRRQLLQSPVDETNRQNVALLFLAGIGNLREAFEVTPLASSEAQRTYLMLTPRSEQAGFSELHIAVNTQSYYVEKLLIHDSIGNTTEIRLSSLQTQQELPPKTFDLTIAPDTEILTPADFTKRK